jgi:AcrR family transcriptional regulator
VLRIIRKDGVAAVTTNRIAEVAGISIGSLYQYFPDKRAIFLALHDRHAHDIAALIDATVVAHAAAPFEQFVAALLGALIDAHHADPELGALLAEVPLGTDGTRALQTRLQNAFRLALAARPDHYYSHTELAALLFVLPPMVDALTHAAAAQARSPKLSLATARAEAIRAVLTYVRARALP